MASTTRDSWQDPIHLGITVPAAKSVEAAEVFRGFLGSWAAEYVVDSGMQNDISTPTTNVPAASRVLSSHLGQPGFPEINFVPYAHGTNRFGPKGGALLGHPVSFSIIGPTLKKGSRVNWQWKITDNSGTLNGDYIDLDDYVADFSVPPPVEVGLVGGVAERYGITDMTDCPDGLYLVISHPGNTGELLEMGSSAVGGVGGGSIWQWVSDPGNTRYGLTPQDEYAKYEIFRVKDVHEATGFELDPNKRLADYFTFHAPGADVIDAVRGITLFEPKAARLVAVQDGTAAGQETTFIVVPPDRACQDDQLYPYEGQPANTGWSEETFAEDCWSAWPTDGTLDTYSEYEYRHGSQPPIEKPIGQVRFRLFGTAGEGAAPDVGPGRMLLVLDDATKIVWGASPSIGDIVRIFNIRLVGDTAIFVAPTGQVPPIDCLLGSFEVVRYLNATTYIVRRMDEVNPETGRSFFGNAPLLAMYNDGSTVVGDRIEVEATIHHPVSQLWDSYTYDIDAIDSARLTNLVDPSWIGRSLKGRQDSLFARADRAIFDTTKDATSGATADPGSLLDLGFRMVFYPAKVRTTEVPDPQGGLSPWADPYLPRDLLVPDFDRPIQSHEVLLDPSKPNEKQFINVDYSNGIVTLSHPVVNGSPLYNAAIFSADDNPRATMVLFASFVPYSREAGQLGTGIRARGGAPVDERDVWCAAQGTEHESADVYSARLVKTLAPTMNVIDPFRESILFELLLVANAGDSISIPPAGFVEVLSGYSADGSAEFLTPEHRGSLFGYYAAVEAPGMGIYLFGRYGGGTVADGAFTYDATHPGVAVFRKDINLPNSLNGEAGTPYQFDTTYGYGKRSTSVHFGDSELQHNTDGSISVIPRATIARSVQDSLNIVLGQANLLDGGMVSVADTADDATFSITDITVLWQGEHHVSAARELIVAKLGTPQILYVVWNPEVGTCGLAVLPDLPVGPDYILLAKAEIPAQGPGTGTVLTDLRYPLKDFDERTDILVGQLQGLPSTDTPWFLTLAEAVTYASELMTPASGDSSKALRILVVGPTVETETPIQIKTDGLIVEGVGRRTSGGDPHLVWTGEHPLIDFNGCNNLIFRNLTVQSQAASRSGALVTATGTTTALQGSARVYTTEALADPYITVDTDPAGDPIALAVGGGATVQLKATTYNAVAETYTWWTSNVAIATVAGGLVTSGAVTGVVYITATGDITGAAGTFRLVVHDGVTPAVVVGGQIVVRDGDTSFLKAETVNDGAGDPGGYNWTAVGSSAVTVAPGPAETTIVSGTAELPCTMFTNTSGLSDSVIVENCSAANANLTDTLEGFLYIRGAAGLTNSRIIGNECILVSDFGFYIGGTGSTATGLVIEGNRFDKSTSPAMDRRFTYRIPDVFPGGITLDADTTSNNRISNNVLSDFGGNTLYPMKGIEDDIFAGDNSWVENNTVDGTWPSIEAGNFSEVRGNHLSSTTIIFNFLVGTNSHVVQNTASSLPGSLGIFTVGGYSHIAGNWFEGVCTLASDSQFTGNTVVAFGAGAVSNVTLSGNKSGAIALGDVSNVIVADNYCGTISMGDVTGTVVTGNLCASITIANGYFIVSDNDVTGALDLTANSAGSDVIVVTGNRVSQASTITNPRFGAIVQANNFADDLTFPTGADKVQLTGNIIGGDLSMPLIQAGHVVADNIIVGTATIHSMGGTIRGNRIIGSTITGPGCIIADNNIGGDLTIESGCNVLGNVIDDSLLPNPDPDATGTPVVGNRITTALFDEAAPGGGLYTATPVRLANRTG